MNCRAFLYPGRAALLSCCLACANAAAEDDFASDQAVSNCVVEPKTVVEISSRIDGILDQVTVDRGDWISAGTVVATLESGVERAAVERASARARMESEILSSAASLEYGERTRERVNQLHAKRVISTDEVDRVNSEAEIARYRLQLARENKRLAELELVSAREVLKRHTILSPIEGVIAERFLNPGESVEEKAIVRIAQINPLRVEMVMPAAEYGQIKAGDNARVRLENGSDISHLARVTIVDPLIDAASGTFRITLELPNPEHALTSGLRCAVSFVAPEADAEVAQSIPPAESHPSLAVAGAAQN